MPKMRVLEQNKTLGNRGYLDTINLMCGYTWESLDTIPL